MLGTFEHYNPLDNYKQLISICTIAVIVTALGPFLLLSLCCHVVVIGVLVVRWGTLERERERERGGGGGGG